jgi:UDP-N-acetylmuramate dehydrogenase
MKKVHEDLIKKFGADKLKFNEPLGKYTTIGLGGPAQALLRPESNEELQDAAKFAFERDIPLSVLGGGSNTLIADRGIEGLVILNRSGSYKIGERNETKSQKQLEASIPKARWELDGKTVRYHFKDLDYDETDEDRIRVTVDSGVNMFKFLYELISKGITGLQWYAGIPGTVGGAIFNNIHGGTHFLSEVVNNVRALTPEGELIEFDAEDLSGDYDYTKFHEESYVILDAVLNLYLGNPKKAKYVADEWRKRKQKVQPQKSLGCAFANISQEEREELDFPTTSVGYIVEHQIEFSGYGVGQAYISKAHHNFIEVKPDASSADYLQVMKDVKQAVKEKFDIDLVPEIMFKGFNEDELEGLVN